VEEGNIGERIALISDGLSGLRFLVNVSVVRAARAIISVKIVLLRMVRLPSNR
jgi:hypothetical protein